MVYSKMHHKKFAYQIIISLKKTECPVCKSIGEYQQDNEDIICKCGFIIQTPNRYVAGKKINTNANFHKQKEHKKNDE